MTQRTRRDIHMVVGSGWVRLPERRGGKNKKKRIRPRRDSNTQVFKGSITGLVFQSQVPKSDALPLGHAVDSNVLSYLYGAIAMNSLP